MTRRLFTALVVVAALSALVSAGPAVAVDSPKLSRGGEAKFPHRSFVLSLPASADSRPGDVSVLENGKAVHELSVTPADAAAAGQLGTVLVIDASHSMRGTPIRRAMAAARAFANHRHPSQKLGVVTFNRRPHVLLAPTTDASAIDAALSGQPPLTRRTVVRDGAMRGLQMLEEARVRTGSVIVLSDGADTGSRASADDVAAAADDLGARVFTVGLESGHFSPRLLTQLAADAGGEYIAASSPKELAAVYDELGARLAREFLITYSSVAGRGNRVRVDAVVDGYPSRATITYTAPRLEAPPPRPAADAPKANGLWGSAVAMVLVGFGVAFLVFFALALGLNARRRAAESPEQRVAAFVAMGEAASRREDAPERGRLYEGVEQMLGRHERWVRFATAVEIGRINRKPAQIAVLTLLTTLFVMWLFTAISGAAWVGLFALLVPWGVNKYVMHRAAKQRTLFGEQLADNLQVIASAMRAGQSFGGALAVAVEDAPEPAKEEFERVVADEQLGVPLEKSLGVVVDRMDNRDLHQVALVAALQREAGGNSAEVLDRVSDTIRERVALRRLISTLTAQGRMSRWVVSLVPVGLVLFIGLTKPGYLDPLFQTTLGNVMLVLAAVMGVSGSLVIKRIVQIKV